MKASMVKEASARWAGGRGRGKGGPGIWIDLCLCCPRKGESMPEVDSTGLRRGLEEVLIGRCTRRSSD